MSSVTQTPVRQGAVRASTSSNLTAGSPCGAGSRAPRRPPSSGVRTASLEGGSRGWVAQARTIVAGRRRGWTARAHGHGVLYSLGLACRRTARWPRSDSDACAQSGGRSCCGGRRSRGRTWLDLGESPVDVIAVGFSNAASVVVGIKEVDVDAAQRGAVGGLGGTAAPKRSRRRRARRTPQGATRLR